MPTLEYPQPMVAPHGPFPPIPDIPKSFAAQMDTLRRHAATIHLGDVDDLPPVNLRQAPSPLVGVTQLHVSVGGDHSTSFHNGADTAKAPAILPFKFCPGDDDVTVSWKVRNHAFVAAATLEIHAARLVGPISSLDVTAALANGRGVSPGATGGLTLLEAVAFTDDHQARFPTGVLTVEHSPYRFVLKLRLRLGVHRECYPSTAWTFGHVLAESIELSWGEARLIPAGTIPGVIDPMRDGRYNAYEADLFRAVTGGALTAPRIHVVLTTNAFSTTKIDIAERVPNPFGSNHEALTKIWGKGPRFPLRAKVHVAKHDGSRAGGRHAARALGRVCLLWDWEDDPNKYARWMAAAHPHLPYISREYVKRAFDLPEPNGPPGSTNCPVAHGGRRGDLTDPVFPPSGANDPFGFEVRPAGVGRPWSAIGVTGVGFKTQVSSAIFQPAPIAGDCYKVTVSLTADPADPLAARDDKPMLAILDVSGVVPPSPPVVPPGPNDPPVLGPRSPQLTDAIAAALLNGIRVPHAATGVFEIRRKAQVCLYEHPTGAAGPLIPNIQAYYLDFVGMELDIVVKPLPANVMTRTWPRHVTAQINQSLYTLIHHFCFDNPSGPVPPAQLLALRTYAQVSVLLKDLVRRGHVYTTGWVPMGRIGEPLVVGPTWTFILAVRGTGAVVVTADPAQALNENTASREGGGRVLGPLKRHLFGAPIIRVVQSATPNERTVRVVFSAAGQSQTATLEFSRIILSKDPLPGHTQDRLVQALRALEGAIVQGQALDGALSVELRGQWNVEKCRGWTSAIRAAVISAVNATFETLDVDGLVNGYLQGEPAYRETVRKSMKPIVQTLTATLRRSDEVAFPGTVYLLLQDPAAIGNAGIGGNFVSEPIGAGYVTTFPGAGFWQQAGYALEDVTVHELGHAFWRPHAEQAIFGGAFNDGSSVKEHVPEDTCLMNYDPEEASLNFCGLCLLDLHGWKNPPARLLSTPEATAQLEREVAAEGNPQVKAWLQLRRALIESRAAVATSKSVQAERTASQAAWTKVPRDLAEANRRAALGLQAGNTESAALAVLRQWLDHAALSWGGVYNQPSGMGISFLRALIRGRIRAADMTQAWTNWRALRLLTQLPQDLADAHSAAKDMLPGIVQTIAIRENNADVAVAVRQYVNLPPDPKFVDGVKVTHKDRTGSQVNFRMTTDGTVGTVQWALLGHHDNPHAPHDEVVPGAFVGAAPGYTLAHEQGAVSATDAPPFSLIPNDATHFIAKVSLPGPGKYRLAIVGDGGIVLSPEVTAVRMIFVTGTVLVAAAGTAADMGALAGALQTAYSPAGYDIVNLGVEPLAWPDIPTADDYAGSDKTRALAQAADATLDLACRIAYSQGATSYRDLAPYVYQFLFAHVLMHWAGVGRYSQAVDIDPLTPRVLVPVKGRGGNGTGMLWMGTPGGLDTQPAIIQPTYLGGTVPLKRWLLRGHFRSTTTAQDYPLTEADVEGRESDAAQYAGRYDRIEVDLTRIAGLVGGVGNLVGTLKIEVIVVSFRGGVDMKDHAPSKAMALITTTQSWSGHANPPTVQQSMAIHEMGHSLGMVVSDGTNPDFYSVGGPHCAAGVPPPPGLGIDDNHYNTNVALATCVMFHRVRQVGPNLAYCDVCKGQLRRMAWGKFG